MKQVIDDSGKNVSASDFRLGFILDLEERGGTFGEKSISYKCVREDGENYWEHIGSTKNLVDNR